MSDGWDVVGEYASTVAFMVEEKHQLNAEIVRLTQELTDACHDIEHMTGLLCQQALLIATLKGISTCSTCEVCRGAAEMALAGIDPHIPSWPPREAEHGDLCYGFTADFRLEGLRCHLCGHGLIATL
jgi:hypothetical protein